MLRGKGNKSWLTYISSNDILYKLIKIDEIVWVFMSKHRI